MFEFSVIRKYLIPKKRHLSVSLIGMMSFFVIASVVWLILIFLSVTSGIEQNWLSKLTQLNAPVQITPTHRYYHSYYYLVDQYSSASSYHAKTLREKKENSQFDPYDPSVDFALPRNFPKAEGKDLVKELFECVNTLKSKHPDLGAQDFEVAPTLLKVKLFRPSRLSSSVSLSQNVITQASYLQSIMDENPSFGEVLLPPTEDDLDQLLSKLRFTIQSPLADQPSYEMRKEFSDESSHRILEALFQHGHVEEVALHSEKPVFAKAFVEEAAVRGLFQDGALHIKEDLSLPLWKISAQKIVCENENLFLSLSTPIYFDDGLTLSIEKIFPAFFWHAKANHPSKALIKVSPFEVSITKASPQTHFEASPEIEPVWAYKVQGSIKFPTCDSGDPILAPKHLRDQDVRIGDVGYISTGTFSFSAQNEQRLPIQIAGFYDPGIMAVGARALFAPYDLVHTASMPGYEDGVDPLLKNGIQVWSLDFKERTALKHELELLLKDKGLSPYFTVSSLEDYPFARDLLEQFQSDKTLFMLVGFIILCVACSNIIALLMILVKDKRREIGIMQAMGASKKSIAFIFGGVGAFLGLMSCLLGILFAYLTLQNIDTIVSWLSYVQGRAAFNPLFYGHHLPSNLSHDGLIFLLICTPILSLVASLVPATMAMRLSTTDILRSEG